MLKIKYLPKHIPTDFENEMKDINLNFAPTSRINKDYFNKPFIQVHQIVTLITDNKGKCEHKCDFYKGKKYDFENVCKKEWAEGRDWPHAGKLCPLYKGPYKPSNLTFIFIGP